MSYSQTRIERALKTIATPRQQLDSDDQDFSIAVFNAALKRFSGPVTPGTTGYPNGFAAANVLRKRCALPKTSNVDAIWLAAALSQPERGVPLVTDNPTAAITAANAGATVRKKDFDALSVVLTTRPDPATIERYPATARIIILRSHEEDPIHPASHPLIASVVIDETAIIDIYQQTGICQDPIRITVFRDADMTILNRLNDLPDRTGYSPPRQTSAQGTIAISYTSAEVPREPVNEIYDVWKQSQVISDKAKPHPTELILSKTHSSALPNNPSYRPDLPEQALTSGAISDAQLEVIVRAGEAHARTMPAYDDVLERRFGFGIFDGTGAGKTNSTLGIIIDNINKGRRKHIYIAEKDRHRVNVEKAARALGMKTSEIFDLNAYPDDRPLPNRNGILFTTYSVIRAMDPANPEHFPRIEQILEWAGSDFEGVLTFNEAQNMRNSISNKERMFTQEPSAQGIAGLLLDARLPMARIVYETATGATDPHNLAYMTRFGLWGPWTASPTRDALIQHLITGGIAAMEATAAHLSSCGLISCRTLSFKGVTYRSINHRTSGPERETFDAAVKLLNTIRTNLDQAINRMFTYTDRSGRIRWRTNTSRLTLLTRSQFESMAKRLVDMLYTALKTPSAIADIRQRLDAGDACIIQIANTYESTRIHNGDYIRSQIRNFVHHWIKPWRTEYKETTITPLLDEHGNMIRIPENEKLIEALDDLIDKLGDIKTPLDQLFDAFGTHRIAEITGRTSRVVPLDPTGSSTTLETLLETRSEADIRADLNAFQQDRKQILIFTTAAGGTSMDYHASLDFPNQRKRQHYLLQAGNRADEAIQGIGRSHRSHQATPPCIVIVSTDIPGEKAYRSQIMRKIARLGAIGQGHRDAPLNSALDPRDNYEGPEASVAWHRVLKQIAENKIPSLNRDLFNQTTQINFSAKHDRILFTASVHTLLNRVARAPIAFQQAIFELLDREIDLAFTRAITDRTYDSGPRIIPGQIEIRDTKLILSEPVTGGNIHLHTFMPTGMETCRTYEQALEEAEIFNLSATMPAMCRNRATGNVWLRIRISDTEKTGTTRYRIIQPHRSMIVDEFSPLITNSEQVHTIHDFRSMWDGQVKNIHEMAEKTQYLATGALPLLWNRLIERDEQIQLSIAETPDGRRYIGTILSEERAAALLKSTSPDDSGPRQN